MESRSPTPPVDRPRAPGRGTTVALIGQDGAGKSTIARAVSDALPFDAGLVYMGVNLDASSVMLPTTRLALGLKRRGGRRADMTAPGDDGTRPVSVLTGARRLVRSVNWIAEEMYRSVLVRRIRRRGAVAIQDRDFYCDYYWSAVAPTSAKRRLDIRMHGAFLRRWYPKPDLVLLLDAPAEVLHRRRGDQTLESVAERRARYLDLVPVLRTVQVVDADRPPGEVAADITQRIVAFVGTSVPSSRVNGTSPDVANSASAKVAP